MTKILFTSLLLLLPSISFAAGNDFQTFLVDFVKFVNGIVIPFILGIAFLFFVVNAFRFFILGGSNEDGREKAKALAIYGVLAFVIIVIFWGVMNMFSSSLGLDGCTQPQSDYVLSGFVGAMPPNCP